MEMPAKKTQHVVLKAVKIFDIFGMALFKQEKLGSAEPRHA
tara:strand:+ start:757 stop:879 length:123 start_codon:yes stop_codon:yes gene_type:complete